MTTVVMNTGAATPENTAAPAGHDEAMLARFEKSEQQATGTGNDAPKPPTQDRPSWLPEKFKTPEDLARAYDELQRKLGQQPPKTEATTEAPKTEDAPQATQESAKDALAASGLDYDAFSREFAEAGTLSDDSYERLNKAGIPRDVVDAYIEGQRAVAAGVRNEVLATVGGEQTYTDMVQWAAANMSKAEIDAFNSVVDGRDKGQVMLAVQGLKARYEAANGSNPKLINGSTTGNSGAVFRSTAELTAAMRDPRYRTDSAYRADVEQRLSRSNIF